MDTETPTVREFAVSAYSARAYFAELLLSESETTLGLRSWTLRIPSHGVVHVQGDPQVEKSLAWIDGLCFQSSLDEDFATQIKRGLIPRMDNHRRRLSPTLKVFSIAPLKSVRLGSTLLSILQLREEVVSALLESRARLCRICGARLRLFKSSSEIEKYITNEWNGQAVELTVRGGEPIADWAREHGTAHNFETR